MDIGVLLEQLMPDPMAVIERVVRQLAGDSRHGDSRPNDLLSSLVLDLASASGVPPDEMLTVAISNQLARILRPAYSGSDPLAAGAWSPNSDYKSDGYDVLVERNSVIAAALGACDCWGEHADCPLCDGAGGPGWMRPDLELFTSYVNPALSVVWQKEGGAQLSMRQTDERGKDDRNV